MAQQVGWTEFSSFSGLDPTKARRLPLFIASTFRDMDRERDLLNNVVVPEVNARLRARGEWRTTIYPVDLRWGIHTDESASAEARERQILLTCTDEVRRCRPLFLGLLGERYGWIVPHSARHGLQPLRATRGIDQPLSVTAIELLTAAEAARADGVPPVILRRGVGVPPLPDAAAPARSTPEEARRVEVLAGHLADLGCDVRSYEAHWDTVHECLASEDFVAVAVDAVLGQLGRVLTRLAGRRWFDVELDAQRVVAENARGEVIGREDPLAEVTRELGFFRPSSLIGDDPKHPLWDRRRTSGADTIVVTGEDGAGVSSFLSEVERLESDRLHELAGIAARRATVQVGITELSKRLEVVLLLLMAQLRPDLAAEVLGRRSPADLSVADVLPAWLYLLRSYRPGERVVVIVDGVDRLQQPQVLPDLTWLPHALNDRAVFVLGVRHHSLLELMLEARPHTRWITLAPLSVEAATELVSRRTAAAHKTLPRGLVSALVRGNRLPGWLALATDLMLTLMADSYRLLEPDVADDPERRLRDLLNAVARHLPPTLDGLRIEHLERVLELVDVEDVSPVILALAVSETPLRDEDMLALCALGERGTTPLQLSLLRSALGGALRPGRDWIAADFATAVALRRFVKEAGETVGGDAILGARVWLIRHLVSLPVDDALREGELLRQLLLVGSYRDFVVALADPALSTERAMVAGVSALVGAPGVEAAVAGLCAAADTADRQLTLAGLLLTGVAPSYPAARRPTLLARVLDLIDRGAGGVARAGVTEATLRGLLAAAAVRYGQAPHQLASAVAWLRAVGDVPPRATLADAPATFLEWPEETRHLARGNLTATWAMIRAAQRTATGTVVLTKDELLLASAWLTAADGADLPAGPQSDARDLTSGLARAAISHAAGDEVSRGVLGSLIDRARVLYGQLAGEPDALRLWSLAVRLTADIVGSRLSEEVDTPKDAALVATLVPDFEEVISHLDMLSVLIPDDLTIAEERILARVQYAGLLHACRQHASAAQYGVPAVSDPRALDILGTDALLQSGGSFVFEWARWPSPPDESAPSPTDPSGWIDQVSTWLEDADFAPPEGAETIEAVLGLAILAAAEVSRRFGRVEPLLRLVGLLRRREPRPAWRVVAPSLWELLHDLAVENETELLPSDDHSTAQWVASLDDLDEDFADAPFTPSQQLDALAAFRTALDPTEGSVETQAALSLFAAVRARVNGDEAAHRDATRRLESLDPEHGTHADALVRAARVLVGRGSR